jgi:deoxyribodipyrimidine photo-lyase
VQLGDSAGHETYRKELAWREFYADVLFHNPHTLDDYYNSDYATMRYADPVKDAALLKAWEEGRTGFPIVDAAMRQLRETGWMHNRSRMIVASFLVKDLHFEWQVGARHFEKWLTDFDPASNSHGWQWTAGCGTDASPYYRVFNPTLQGEKFDPNGDYVRKYVPELAHISGSAIHQPWLLVDGLAHGYPAPIVDHFVERDEALARLKDLKA